jgi:hypothetical protein
MHGYIFDYICLIYITKSLMWPIGSRDLEDLRLRFLTLLLTKLITFYLLCLEYLTITLVKAFRFSVSNYPV